MTTDHEKSLRFLARHRRAVRVVVGSVLAGSVVMLVLVVAGVMDSSARIIAVSNVITWSFVLYRLGWAVPREADADAGARTPTND